MGANEEFPEFDAALDVLTSRDKSSATVAVDHRARAHEGDALPVAGDSTVPAIRFTVFPDVKAQRAEEHEASWPDLVALIKNAPRRSSKRACELLKLATFGKNKTENGSLRHDENLQTLYGIEGDYDAGTVSPVEAAQCARDAGVEALFYTSSRNMQQEGGRELGPRWRALFPLSRPHAPDEHQGLVSLANGALGGILGSESWTLSQTYYFGQVDGVAYEVIHVPGTCIDRLDLLITPIGKGSGKTRESAAAPTASTADDNGADDLGRQVALDRVSDETLRELESALAAIPSDDRDLWVRMGHALKTLGAPGQTLWINWASASDKFDPDDVDYRWDGLKGNRTDYRAAFAEAQRRGWKNPKSGQPLPTQATPGRFKFETAAVFAQRKPPEWIIKGALIRAALAVIYGESGSGKSFFALDLVGAIARGVEWCGLKVKRGRVAYVAAEGAGGFRNRLVAYAERAEVDLADLDIRVLAAAPNLMQDADVTDLTAALKSFAPDVVVIDTLAQTTPGADENSAEGMGRALGHCRQIHEATGALVVLIHHCGKDKTRGMRGWSGLLGACDTVFEVTRDGEERTARLEKVKDGEDGAEFNFRLPQVSIGKDTDGEAITTCVVIPSNTPKVTQRREPSGRNQKAVWRVVNELSGFGDVNRNTLIDTAIARLMPPVDGKEDSRRSRVTRALGELVDDGALLYVGENMVRVPT